MRHDWKPADRAPDGVVVMTKIDDDKGCRNETTLRRSGRLWFVPDGSMYVYYTPTHYRLLTIAEDEAWREKIKRAAAALAAQADR